MKYPMNAVKQVVETLIRTDSWKATKYLTDRTIIRATRMRERGRFRDGRQNMQVNLTFGRPNYLEVRFIKDAKKAGEPFPIRQVQLKALPKRRGK